MGEINPANLKLYRCTTWTEGDSHGGAIDTTSEILSGNINNIFDNVSNAERENGMTDYRKVFLRNENASTWPSVVAWIQQLTNATNDEVSIALGTDGGTKADEGAGLSYVQPTTSDHTDVLSIGDLAQDEYQAIWIKRIVTAGGNGYTNNTFQLAADSV